MQSSVPLAGTHPTTPCRRSTISSNVRGWFSICASAIIALFMGYMNFTQPPTYGYPVLQEFYELYELSTTVT